MSIFSNVEVWFTFIFTINLVLNKNACKKFESILSEAYFMVKYVVTQTKNINIIILVLDLYNRLQLMQF